MNVLLEYLFTVFYVFLNSVFLIVFHHYVYLVFHQIHAFLNSISPFPALLHEYANASKWNEAIRLCRFVKVCVVTITLIGNGHSKVIILA